MKDLYTPKGLERINRLEKRYIYLLERINSSEFDLSFDKAEASALSWAIEILHKLREEKK